MGVRGGWCWCWYQGFVEGKSDCAVNNDIEHSILGRWSIPVEMGLTVLMPWETAMSPCKSLGIVDDRLASVS